MNFNTRQLNIINATEPKILCLAAAASGKAIPVDTILPTPDGPKEAGNIKIGDYLFDRNGKPTKIIGVYPQGKKEVYEITFGDGRKAKCCNEHIWYVHDQLNNNSSYEITTKELLQQGLYYYDDDKRPRFYIPNAKSVEYSEKSFEISPYDMGVKCGNNIFIKKSVLQQYEYGSIEQRKAFIKGVLDAINAKSKSLEVVGVLTSNYDLVCTIKTILASLGHFHKIDLIRPLNSDSDIRYLLDVVISERKDRVAIVKIESLCYETEMVCFEVDNSEHLYLMNDFIVTHNTAVLTARVKHLIDSGVEQKDIVAITFTNLAAKEMKKRLGDIVNDDMFIGTVHSYALKICGLNEISMYNAIKEEEYDEILRTAASLPTSKFPKIKHLLVDESQDLTALEYSFIDKIPTENIFYCGDPRQNIFQFRGGSDRFIINKYNDIEYKNYFLNINYRNAPNILNFANSLIASSKKYGLEDVPIKKMDGICEKISFNEAISELEDSGNWGAWAILARTNNEVDLIQKILEGKDIPSITFKKSDFDNPDQIDAAMLNNAVKVLTQHSSKGLEFPSVIGVGAKVYNEAERNLAYVTATRAMNALYWCPTLPGARGRRGGFTKTKKEFLENDSQMIEF